VLHEHGTQAGADFAARDRRIHFAGDVPQTCGPGADLERFLVQRHGLWYAIISPFALAPDERRMDKELG